MSPPITQVLVNYLASCFQQITTANGYHTDFGSTVTSEEFWDRHNFNDMIQLADGDYRPPLIVTEEPEHAVLESTSALRRCELKFVANGLMRVSSGEAERQTARLLEADMLAALPWGKCFPDARIESVAPVKSGFELYDQGSPLVEVTLSLRATYRIFKDSPAGA